MLLSPLFSPMLLSRGKPPAGSTWVFEPKWDGFRALAYVTDNGVRLHSRKGADITRLAPELTQKSPCGESIVLDGELVAFESGVLSFDTLQVRLMERPPWPGATAFIAFDLLWQ